MITTQIITYNNEDTIYDALESVQGLGDIVVADLGSNDKTLNLCRKFNVKLYNVNNYDYLEARQFVAKNHKTHQFSIEPWEILLSGRENIKNYVEKYSYVKIISNNVVLKEVRLWDYDTQFVNPIFCKPKSCTNSECEVILKSNGGINQKLACKLLDKWKKSKPLDNQPLFHEACIALSNNDYKQFLFLAEKFLFNNKANNIETILLRYYCAYIYYSKYKDHKSALQYINLCISAKPLLAEFWCFTGDVFYHLLNDYKKAIEFYENAIILGSKRLSEEKFPLDIAKYRKYPNDMIESCYLCLKNINIHSQSKNKI